MTKIQISENPFIAGQPARGNDFFGREDALALIENFLNQNEKKSFFIKGQRRSGKTSFLKRSQDKFKSEKNLILYFNLQDKISGTIKEIHQDIQERIIKYIDNNEITLQNEFKPFLLNLKEKTPRNIILLFDEFDVMCENSVNNKDSETDFISFIIDMINFNVENAIPLKLIIATGSNYANVISKSCKKIETLSFNIILTPFEKKTVEKLLDISQDLPFRENAKKTLNEITAGNPFFTQALASSVYDYAHSHNAQSITMKMVKKRLNSAVKSFSYGVAVIWNDLKDIDKLILYALANIIEKNGEVDFFLIKEYLQENNIVISDNEMIKSLTRLHKSHFIKNDLEKYSFCSEFFRKWVILDIHKREIKNIYTNVKGACK